jgi:hypothetical protein
MRIDASELPTPSVEARVRPPVAPPRATSDAPDFASVLRALGRQIEHGEKTVRSAMGSLEHGADLGPAELIALQAGVYRYAEAVDLASRLIDRATSGVKTVLQGGGQ